jgi:hypothetical protein
MTFTLSPEKNHSAPDQLHVSREKECDILVYQGYNVDRIRSLMIFLGFLDLMSSILCAQISVEHSMIDVANK